MILSLYYSSSSPAPMLYHTATSNNLQSHTSRLSVLWANEVGKRLRLLVVVVAISVVVVVVVVWVISWADVLHLEDVAALWAALNWAIAGHLPMLLDTITRCAAAKGTYGEPNSDVGVSWVAGATSVLLVTKRLDNNWVVERAYFPVSNLSALIDLPRPQPFCACVVGGFLEWPDVPLREASRGFMSKTSTPCIFPRISKRSRPVACSRSVGVVPGAAPGGRRSASDLISAIANPQSAPFRECEARPRIWCPALRSSVSHRRT